MITRQIVVAAFLFATLFPLTSLAENEEIEKDKEKEQSPLTGTFDITSNYIFQGISNTNNEPAFQGGLTYTFLSTGIYLGTWGSNVDFFSLNDEQATVEVDAIGGITNTVGDNFTYNFFIDHYFYPKAASTNYTDFFSVFTYKEYTLTLDYSYHVFGCDKDGFYVNGLINYPIPAKYIHFNDVSFLASIGRYFLPEESGYTTYNDYMLGIQKAFGDYTATLQWTDTNKHEMLEPLGGNHIVGTILYSF